MDQQVTQLFDKMILDHKRITDKTVFVVHPELKDIPDIYKNIPVTKSYLMPKDKIMLMDKNNFDLCSQLPT